VLILDEPTIGLDPEGVQWMRETLRGLAAEGRTVFVSSHLMSELEDTADHLIVIGKGRLLADISVADLLSSAVDGRVEVRTPDLAAAMTVLANAGATPVSSGHDRLAVTGIAPSQVATLLVESRVRLEELFPARLTLEDAYFSLTRDASAHTAERATA
jgi:ABC-2 type transport system ATP-binding protein